MSLGTLRTKIETARKGVAYRSYLRLRERVLDMLEVARERLTWKHALDASGTRCYRTEQSLVFCLADTGHGDEPCSSREPAPFDRQAMT